MQGTYEQGFVVLGARRCCLQEKPPALIQAFLFIIYFRKCQIVTNAWLNIRWISSFHHFLCQFWPRRGIMSRVFKLDQNIWQGCCGTLKSINTPLAPFRLKYTPWLFHSLNVDVTNFRTRCLNEKTMGKDIVYENFIEVYVLFTAPVTSIRHYHGYCYTLYNSSGWFFKALFRIPPG